MEAIEIPPARLAPVARRIQRANRLASATALLLAIGLLVAFAAWVVAVGEGAIREMSSFGVGLPVEVALLVVTALSARNARRANAVAIVAETGRGVTFLLDGRRVEIRDALGREHETLALPIRNKHRAELLEMPPARVLER